MTYLDKIIKVANNLRGSPGFAFLCKAATDLAILEEQRYFQEQFERTLKNIKKLADRCQTINLNKIATELDLIAQDLEKQVIIFSVDDPIQSVLDSYKAIHRVAQSRNDIKQQIISFIEEENYSDLELKEILSKMLLGLHEKEKEEIYYILEKDYNLSPSLFRQAQKLNPEIEIDEDECLQNARTLKDRIKCVYNPEEKKITMYRSWPSAPSIWSGFAYEALIPYHQNSQLNYWSLASINEDKILKRITKT